MAYTDEQWKQHAEFVEKTLDKLRLDVVDSRTLCGTLDQGWVRWSTERRAKQRHLVRQLWIEGSARARRDLQSRFIAGNDSGEKLLGLRDSRFGIDPDDYFLIDPFWVELSMVLRGMEPRIEGLSPMETTVLIREEACELAERLAQLACADHCNVLFMLFTAHIADAEGFLRERSDPDDLIRRYGTPPREIEKTIRGIVNDYASNGIAFADLVTAIVARWRERPAKPTGPATWSEIYNRAELKRDDDDLYWINVAEDLGWLTVEQTDAVFAAIDAAAGGDPKTDDDGCVSAWKYFVGIDGGLIRISSEASQPRAGERYWGATGGWMANSPGSVELTDEVGDDNRYTPVDASKVKELQDYLDGRPGGVFRLGEFWPDRRSQWSVPSALRRVATLEQATSDINRYWTWQEYQSDLSELARLREFLEMSD